MIQPIASSFLFILPILVSHLVQDTVGVVLFSVALGVSVANHSHTFHSDSYRRDVFKHIDVYYMHFLTFVLVVQSLRVLSFSFILFLSFIYYGFYSSLGSKPIEQYTPLQSKLYVYFQLASILLITMVRYVYMK